MKDIFNESRSCEYLTKGEIYLLSSPLEAALVALPCIPRYSLQNLRWAFSVGV